MLDRSHVFALPPGCTIRPARALDRTAIHHLLDQFRQEILPPRSPSEQVLRLLAIALLGAGGAYLVGATGWQRTFNLLLGPTAVLGLAIALVLVITWNSDWENFWVAEHHHQIIGCAKLRRCNHYSLLHDVYVVPEWRSRGLGSSLVAHLGQQALRPLYLTCIPRLVPFYGRLGFTEVAAKSLPRMVQYELGLIQGPFEVVALALR